MNTNCSDMKVTNAKVGTRPVTSPDAFQGVPVLRAGSKVYFMCNDCGKLVRLKRFSGLMHICPAAAERWKGERQ